MLLLLAASCLFAQKDIPDILPPKPDSLHFPVWPGCYDPKMSVEELFRCTRECMATQVYSNIHWPEEKLSNSGFIKVKVQLNDDGSLPNFTIVESLHPLLDQAVMQSMATWPKSSWHAGYINGYRMNTSFEVWIKYNPDVAEDNLVLLKNVKESTYHNFTPTCILVVEHMPYFPGGQSALLRFIAENMTWPESLKESSVEGMMVVQFVVERDGSVTNSKVIKSVHPDFDQVGLNIVNKMPKWINGRARGQPTRVQMNLPIRIKLE
ncbi:TonB family protein [Haliscomenobacter hydrossis]|uniref:TonB family protein n=1 Tax=Haliscomenobacter hydrossis TaxID=2350 RepID=UPI00145E7E3B|nr:TonB family protein [Haliscomenobacter hydrossis]